eukprot:5814240-Ditylum_brightwellii.AAC.1
MSEKDAQSHAGGHFFLGKHTADPANTTSDEVPLNSPIYTVLEMMHNVIASSVEAKIGALYTKAHKGEELHLALEEICHKQPPTPIMTDNSAAYRKINKTVKQHRICAIDMHFYWVHNRVAQNLFIVCWPPRKNNLGIITLSTIQLAISPTYLPHQRVLGLYRTYIEHDCV